MLMLVLAAASSSLSATDDMRTLQTEISAARERLEIQQKALDAERERLRDLETRLDARLGATEPPLQSAVPHRQDHVEQAAQSRADPVSQTPVPTVGEAPTEKADVDVAVLPNQGGIITRKGRLTLQGDLEYSHAENNSVIFRGIGVDAAVLIGVFDINRSRQDVLTAAAGARFGISDRLEINGRLPFVYRADRTVLAPVSDPSTPNAGQLNRPVTSARVGDAEFGVRYQLNDGLHGAPYFIAGVQFVAPTGRGPFSVQYDELGNALQAATGSGFWGVTPNVTAILPTDPAVLFATLGYTFNLGRSFDRVIGPVRVEHVQPGGEPSASFGMALSLNQRAAISFGYAHTMALRARTKLRAINANDESLGPITINRSRSLQLGRLLFGVSYRVSPSTTINWAVETGVTDDSPDVRATIRIPIGFDTGR